MLQFLSAPNLFTPELTETFPWDFNPAQDDFAKVKSMSKAKRRDWMKDKRTKWDAYTAVRGVSRHLRITEDNPAAGIRGLVVDYDTEMDLDTIKKYLSKIKEPAFVPNFIETTLSGNARLVWVFEREVLTPNRQFANDFLLTIIQQLNADKLLPGYDKNSAQSSSVWTNGVEWCAVKETPMPWATVFGILCAVSKKADFGPAEIPLPTIFTEIEKRFPNRWKGPFELNNTGVRFWDERADCPSGCQVKPDGMLCFTGRVPFMKWDAIFGLEWCNSQRAMNLARHAADTYFDGRHYWQINGGKWAVVSREDILLGLRAGGVTTQTKRGQPASDADRVLHYIQKINRVDGAAPIIARPSGLIHQDGNRILNISSIRALVPAEGLVTPEEHFPWLWRYLHGLFDHPELNAIDYWLAWMRRFYLSILEQVPYMGQAVFLCGPRNNGKTLLGYRVIKPLVGDRSANPYDFFTGQTAWNDELFSSPLLMINDEEATTKEESRQKFIARLKSFVVNPSHMHQARFCSRINIDWTGRVFVTLNDDPGSVGLLPYVHNNTRDKMMFFGSRPRTESWGDNRAVEKTIAEQLPAFARFLLNWTPPPHTIETGRMGVASFYDPKIQTMAQQQDSSHTLIELIKSFCEHSAYWGEDKGRVDEWEGTGLEFLNACNFEPLNSSLREWTSAKMSRAFQSLARGQTPGIQFTGNGGRRFKINRATVMQYIEENL